jgi:hypothetical protein
LFASQTLVPQDRNVGFRLAVGRKRDRILDRYDAVISKLPVECADEKIDEISRRGMPCGAPISRCLTMRVDEHAA